VAELGWREERTRKLEEELAVATRKAEEVRELYGQMGVNFMVKWCSYLRTCAEKTHLRDDPTSSSALSLGSVARCRAQRKPLQGLSRISRPESGLGRIR